MEVNLLTLLAIVFTGMVTIVGGYVWFFLHIMRSDPREIEFRKKHGDTYGLVPSKKDKKPLDT